MLVSQTHWFDSFQLVLHSEPDAAISNLQSDPNLVGIEVELVTLNGGSMNQRNDTRFSC